MIFILRRDTDDGGEGKELMHDMEGIDRDIDAMKSSSSDLDQEKFGAVLSNTTVSVP